jgi:hypothetical protein
MDTNTYCISLSYRKGKKGMRDFLEVVAILVAIVAVCEVLSMLTSLVRWVNAKANIAEEQYQQLKQLNILERAGADSQ